MQDSSRARAVLYRIQDQLNEIDGVAVLYSLPTIADLGSGALLSHIAASDQDIFLLDERGRIYQYIVNDVTGESKPATTDGVLLRSGDTVGELPVGAIKLIANATRGQDKSVIAAVTDDALLTYDLEAQQWSAHKVSDAAAWGDLKAIATFGGNIYLLDSKNSQVYKYTPTETGFSEQAIPYFPENSQPRLSRAVDMAIDGDVWVLNDNGTVQRFRGGSPIDFTLQVLPTPLKQPVAIFTQPEVDSLYVADAGNQRIVEFDKNGKFVRQFKPYAEKGDVFKELQDFTVNETKRKMYFTNTHAAYITNVPK
jgi:streptogramin lyase